MEDVSEIVAERRTSEKIDYQRSDNTDETEEQQTESEIFSTYQCRSLRFGKEHPGDISESAGLALIPLPDATYPLLDSITTEIIESGKLSQLQLEGIQYACQRHQRFLPNGDRCGFFIGDGAGVGKGRQIGGIILDNWARGRHQHVWFSISRDLRVDAQRDLDDLGLHLKVVDGCQELDLENKAFGLSSEFKEGVLFTTYSTLIGIARNGKMSRLDQIVAWCGGKEVERRKISYLDKSGSQLEKEVLFAPRFSGVVIFDECHKAKNYAINKEGVEQVFDKGSQTSRSVIEIQQRLPRARVVYCSATGVSELSNLAYCERLGLWGNGLPFPSFELFHQNASKRGVFFLEMLAMELKRSGAYVSRGLSFAQAEFETMECSLTTEMTQKYDAAVALWSKVRVQLQNAILLTGTSRRLFSAYWGAHQRFFRQLILAFKVDFVVEHARYCLDCDQAVVIGLQTTGEAAQVHAMERCGENSESFHSAARETLISFLRLNWPTKIVGDGQGDMPNLKNLEKEIYPKGRPTGNLEGGSIDQKQFRTDPSGAIVPECVETRDRLVREADALELPDSALDSLIDKLGGCTKVAEMTGRKGRVVRTSAGTIMFQQRGLIEDEVDQVNIKECHRFMKGSKLIAIISDAASTGISLHASNSCLNRRRRVHFTIELPWSADKAVQQLGRSHRSNQASAPIYKLIVTDLGGERRFASAVAKRLQSLGALTKGDRRAAAGQDLHEFDLDNMYGRSSLRKMLEAVDQGISIAPGASEHELKRLCDSMDLPSWEEVCVLRASEIRVTSDRDRWIVKFNTHLQSLLESIEFGKNRKETDTGNVSKFLGRLLGLPVITQNLLFSYFFSILEHSIASAIKEGRYTDGISDLFGEDCDISKEQMKVIHTDLATGATTTVQKLRVDRGLSWQAAFTKLKSCVGNQNMDRLRETILSQGAAENMDPESQDEKVHNSCDQDQASAVNFEFSEDQGLEDLSSGFYESKHLVPGRGCTGWLIALRSIGRPNFFVVGRPNTGMSRLEMDENELQEKYIRRDTARAEIGWRKAFDDSISYETGSRILTVHLLTGSLVPLWEQIEEVVQSIANAKHSTLSKRDFEMKVVRVKVDGQHCVGLKFPYEVILALRKRFKLHSLLQSGQALQVHPPHFNHSSLAQLSSGQGLAVPVKILGQAGAQQITGVAVPSLSDVSSFTLTFSYSVGGRKRRVQTTFRAGSVKVQTVMLQDDLTSTASAGSSSCPSPDGGIAGPDPTLMRGEPADPVQPKALSRALTPRPTLLTFFTSASARRDRPGSPEDEGTGTVGGGALQPSDDGGDCDVVLVEESGEGTDSSCGGEQRKVLARKRPRASHEVPAASRPSLRPADFGRQGLGPSLAGRPVNTGPIRSATHRPVVRPSAGRAAKGAAPLDMFAAARRLAVAKAQASKEDRAPAGCGAGGPPEAVMDLTGED